MQKKMSIQYQITLVLILSINFGVLFFDRQALNFLMPFVKPDLKLSDTQQGMLSSALSLTWAISGIFIGAWSDRVGKKKIFIVMAGVLFSMCSVLSGLATGFAMLLGARLLMGATEGAVMPISHSLVAKPESTEHREKSRPATTMKIFFLPTRSDQAPMKMPEMAQVSDRAEDSMPCWVSLSFRSGFTNGIRKFSA